MDFELSDDQRLLQDSITRLLGDRYAFEQRKTYLKATEGFSPAMWTQYAELGLLGLPFAEEYGGFGGGAQEVMLVMQAFGRALILEPYLATVVLGGTALKLAGSDAQKAEILPAIAEGRVKLAFAHSERQARYDLTDVMTTAKRGGGGWVLDGAKSVVVHGEAADRLVLSARTSGDRYDVDGITLFLVDTPRPGWRAAATPRGMSNARPMWHCRMSRSAMGTCWAMSATAWRSCSASWRPASPPPLPRQSARWKPCTA